MRFIMAGAALALATSAHAQTAPSEAPDTLQAVYACAGETEDARRLACYDQAVGRLRVAQEQGQFAAISTEQVRTLERESFGFSLPSLPRLVFPRIGGGEAHEAVAEVSVEIARVEERGRRFAFVTTDGQVWVQLEDASVRRVRPGVHATIRRASLGSYLLVVDGINVSHRVRREQ